MKPLILLLLISSYSYGNGNHSENAHGGATADNSASSASGSGAIAGSRASSNVLIINGSNPDSSGVSGTNGETNAAPYRNIKIDYDNIPSHSAASLTVAYCTEGVSGQGRSGGLVIAGSDTVCRQTRIIGAALPEVMRLYEKGQLQRGDELSEDVTLMIEKMVDDEGFRSLADKSWTAFKAIGPWCLLFLL
jgi:hypothetical protein